MSDVNSWVCVHQQFNDWRDTQTWWNIIMTTNRFGGSCRSLITREMNFVCYRRWKKDGSLHYHLNHDRSDTLSPCCQSLSQKIKEKTKRSVRRSRSTLNCKNPTWASFQFQSLKVACFQWSVNFRKEKSSGQTCSLETRMIVSISPVSSPFSHHGLTMVFWELALSVVPWESPPLTKSVLRTYFVCKTC